MSPPPGRPKEGSLPPGGKARSAKGAPMMPSEVRVGSAILPVRSQPDRRRLGNRGEESPGSAEQDAG